MGMPLNRYGMINQMVDALRCNEPYMDLDFRKFKMFVLVLHDPDDWALCETLNNRFSVLDYQTGPDMLFLTWINPPERWLREHKHFYSFDQDGLCYNVEQDYLSRNLELAEMRLRFGVPENSSALVIFTELMSQYYLVVDTSADSLAQQLRSIGEFCHERDAEEFANRFAVLCSLKDALSTEMQKQDELLADTLVHLLAVGSSKAMFNKEEHTRQQRVERVLKIAEDKLMSTLDTRENAENDFLSLCRLKVLDMENMDDRFRHHDFHCNRKLFSHFQHYISEFEMSSVIYFYTFRRLYECYQRDTFDVLDNSGLIVCLAKILENECNASLYQFCRKTQNVNMPDYYKKFCPDLPTDLQLRYTVGQRSFSCPINRFTYTKNNGRALENRTLGEIVTLVHWLHLENMNNNPAELYHLSNPDVWQQFVNIRNQAAHAGTIMNQWDLNDAIFLFEKLLSDSSDALMRMKMVCRQHQENRQIDKFFKRDFELW